MAKAALALAALGCLAGSDRAWAHALGQRYDLPLPLWLYLLGAATAVAASFAFLTLFRKNARARPGRAAIAKGSVPGVCVVALRSVSVIVFLIVVAAGLFGNQNPMKNIMPIFVWVLWWVGFTFVCAFVVDLWPMVSPFALIFEAADRLARRLYGRTLVIGWHYPCRFGAWPAFMVLLLFAFIELIAPNRDSPRALAIGSLVFACCTFIGCTLFGPRAWLRNGEGFAVAFRLLGRFAPFSLARGRRRWAWRLRPFAIGLLSRAPLSASLTAFTLLMLATVSVDGFLETPPWAALMERLTPAAASPLTQAAPPHWPATVLLCLAPGLFGLTYLLVMRLMTLVAPASPPARQLAGRFVLTLVPIAIAYHLAHYLSFLLLAGQLAIPLASDPFGAGWDLFGTTLYRLDIGIIDARMVWFVAVGAIVTGHILATWLAHETALDVYSDPRAARASQAPMLALMVGYTVLSLWILAQPIVETR